MTLIEVYRISYAWLMEQGFTEWEARFLASLRVAWLSYPEAFM